MPHLSLTHTAALDHHILQAQAWLALSAEGSNTTCLGYAALELRYAIERLVVQYWGGLVAGTGEQEELLEIGSFKKIETRIYELAGHQRKIDRGFDFSELLCALLGIKIDVSRPRIPVLKRHWHTCSEICHVGWALAAASADIGPESYAELEAACRDVAAMEAGDAGLERLDNPEMHELRRRYIEGEVSDDFVREFVKAQGLFAEYVANSPGAQPIPVGTPVSPKESQDA